MGCLSGKGMNERFKNKDKNIVKDNDLPPGFTHPPLQFPGNNGMIRNRNPLS